MLFPHLHAQIERMTKFSSLLGVCKDSSSSCWKFLNGNKALRAAWNTISPSKKKKFKPNQIKILQTSKKKPTKQIPQVGSDSLKKY